MHQSKREQIKRIEKKEEVQRKSVNCINCNKIIAEIEEVVMGRVLVKCKHCGTKNRIDREAVNTGVGCYL